MLITISNLFPRPDQPTRGLYNFYLFREMRGLVGGYRNVCLVPEWRVWKWAEIRQWKAPGQTAEPGEKKSSNIDIQDEQDGGGALFPESSCSSCLSMLNATSAVSHSPPTVYLPVFYLPLVGRSINWWFCCRALRGKTLDLRLQASNSRGGKNSNIDIQDEQDGGGALFPESSCKSCLSMLNTSTVCYVPWLYPDGVAAARAIRGTGAKLWLMALGSDTFHLRSPMRRRLILEACEQAEGIVCVAQVLADRLAAAGVPAEKLHVVPNGVDTSLFRVRKEKSLPRETAMDAKKNDGPSMWGGCPHPPDVLEADEDIRPTQKGEAHSVHRILFVGNLVPIKGPDILLKAFSKLLRSSIPGKAKNSNIDIQDEQDGEGALFSESSCKSCPSMLNVSPVLLIIGSGPMQAELERLATTLGIADHVHFLGRRPPEEVALWMNAADVLCLSSRSEGMPNVVLEARASGLPVVATPAGAVPELMLDKEHFLVVQSCRPEDLAEGLRDMLSRDLSSRHPDPAIHSWGQMASTILELIKRESRAKSRKART